MSPDTFSCDRKLRVIFSWDYEGSGGGGGWRLGGGGGWLGYTTVQFDTDIKDATFDEALPTTRWLLISPLLAAISMESHNCLM